MKAYAAWMCLVCAIVSIPSALCAQGPSVDEIVRQLRPPAGQAGQPAASQSNILRRRGVSVEEHVPGPEHSVPSIDLTINFKINSAELTTDTLATLENLASAMQTPDLRPFRFSISGHTDVSGSPTSNLRLSRARAESVRAYLVDQRGIAPDRLSASGFGDTRLKDVADPRSPANRRVQISTEIQTR